MTPDYPTRIRSAPPASLAALVDACAVRLLIVEDNDATRDCYARIFARDGYDVATAAGVTKAVRLATERAPDVVLSDIQLDGHFGDALLDLLPPGPRFVFVTGSEDLDRLERIRHRGAVVVRKPADVPGLVKLVRGLAEGMVSK